MGFHGQSNFLLPCSKDEGKTFFNSLDYCHGSSFLPESFPPSFFRASPLDGVDVWVLNTKLRDATGLRIGPVRLVLKLADKPAEAVLL